LIDIVGEENYTDEVIDLISYSSDTSEHKHRPEGAVWPMNTGQVSEVLKLANELGFPVPPRGAGNEKGGAEKTENHGHG
jgi:FAD/FMN-containing dehydrogenase